MSATEGSIRGTLEERVAARTDSLSAAERKVAHYLAAQPDKAAFASAAELGRLTETSDATVIRTIKSLGYDGLPATDVGELATWFRTRSHSGSLERYLEPFSHTVAVMQTPEALHRVAYECVEDLAEDSVVYAEIRFAPELHIDRGLSFDAIVDAVLAGFADGEKACAAANRPIVVRLLVPTAVPAVMVVVVRCHRHWWCGQRRRCGQEQFKHVHDGSEGLGHG